MRPGTTTQLWLGPLSLIDWNGGTLESRIRLQKAAYLLKHLGVQPFASAKFVYHYYGPYSREFSDALHQLVVSGLIEESRDEYDATSTKYIYKLTPAGKSLLSQVEFNDPQVAALAQRILQPHWRVLELAATALFVQKEEGLPDRHTAMERALELKPECTDYRSQSEELLQALSA
jgi:uncharacterized protein YwgA